MISTGATIEEALNALLEAGCSDSGVKVVATHGLFVGAAAERLAKLPIEKFYLSDSVPPPPSFPIRVETCSLAPRLAETIRHLNHQ